MAKRHLPPPPSELDQLIHERLRLGIICALAVQESLTFTELRDVLQTTDGNLSVQARRLDRCGAGNGGGRGGPCGYSVGGPCFPCDASNAS